MHSTQSFLWSVTLLLQVTGLASAGNIDTKRNLLLGVVIWSCIDASGLAATAGPF